MFQGSPERLCSRAHERQCWSRNTSGVPGSPERLCSRAHERPGRPVAATLPAGCDDGRGMWRRALFSAPSSDSALQARGALVRASQPLGQPLGRFGWGGSVERHHGCRCARAPQQLRPPARTGRGHFDQVVAASDVFFESVNGHGAPAEGRRLKNEAPDLLDPLREDQAKGIAKLRTADRSSAHLRPIHVPNLFCPQLLNRICTNGPQDFHSVGRWNTFGVPRVAT